MVCGMSVFLILLSVNVETATLNPSISIFIFSMPNVFCELIEICIKLQQPLSLSLTLLILRH